MENLIVYIYRISPQPYTSNGLRYYRLMVGIDGSDHFAYAQIYETGKIILEDYDENDNWG